MARKMLEDRQQAGVAESAGEGTGVGGHGGRVVGERPITDHGVGALVRNIDDGREVDGDAQTAHLTAPAQRQLVDLVGGLGLRQCACRGRRPDQRRQAGDPAALLIDADRQGQCSNVGDIGEGAIGEHRQVGPAADHDAADAVVTDHGAGVGGVADPHHE